ncbi:hypothetical protein TNCV_2329481 [Trichonephila clavipes]|nr:hypothetical protein TNCV_2329481 [Trichonephila clavipes]
MKVAQRKGGNSLTCLQKILKSTNIHLLAPIYLGQQVAEGRSKVDCWNRCSIIRQFLLEHYEIRIISSESGTRVHCIRDNVDINGHTLVGNNALHVIGMIKTVIPKDAVLYHNRIQKCSIKPSAKWLAAMPLVSLLAYGTPIVSGYSRIQVENL